MLPEVVVNMGAKHSSQQHGFTAHHRAMLLWVWRRVPTWTHVSTNILREVVDYLPTFRAQMVWVKESKVLGFDLDIQQWKSLFTLHSQVPVSPSSYALLLDGDQVLLRTNAEQEARLYLLTAGVVERMPDLLELCELDGFICRPYTRAMYSFGGLGTTALRTAEVLARTQRKWQVLPQMTHSRHSFNPCLHLDYIYLCGGNESGSSERFNPITQTYEDIALVTNPGSSVTISLGESLLVYSSHLCQHWKDQILEKREHRLHSLVSSCAPLFVRDCVYLFNPFLMKAYELTLTGETRLL